MSKSEGASTKIAFGLLLVVLLSLGVGKPALDLGFASIAFTEIAFMFVFATVVVRWTSFRVGWHSVFASFLFYIAALTIAGLFAGSSPAAFVAWLGKLYLILLAVVTSLVVNSRKRLRLAFLALIGGSMIPTAVGILAIVLFYLSRDSVLLGEITYHYGAAPYGNFPRINSTLVSPSMFCNYLTVVLLAVLISAKMNWISVRWAFPILLAIAICAAFTVSIALGGFFFAFGTWIAFDTEYPTLIRRTSLVIACFAAALFSGIAFFSLESIAEGDPAASSRILVWRSAIETFVAHPIFGTGLGKAVADVAYQNSDGSYSYLIDAHNTALSVSAQSGLVGLAALIVLVAVIVRSGWRTEGGDPELSVIRRGLLIAFIATFIYDGLTSSFEDARHLWVLMGLMLAVNNLKGKDPDATDPPH